MRAIVVQIGARNERLVVRSGAAERCVRWVEELGAEFGHVVISGEGGVGKTLLARYLVDREAAPRSKRTWVDAASPNAATGLQALSRRLLGRPKGRRTIVVDNVGPEVVRDVGDLVDRTRYVEGRWRVISVLGEEVGLGALSEHAQVVVPPLRERRSDIPQLVRQLSLRACEASGRSRVGISGAAMELLEAYEWPGNVGELADVVDRAISLRDDLEVIDVPELPARLRRRPTPELDVTIEEVVRQHTLDVLATHRGNRSAAAKVLGISRNTLIRKLNGWRTK